MIPIDFDVFSYLEEMPKLTGIEEGDDCPPEKVWNRYDKVCFDVYNMFDKTARESKLLKN